jgi:23S rRNA pseudouridine1911/1915/1917 synthase
VTVNSAVCVDETRRLNAGDVISVHSNPAQRPIRAAAIQIVYADDHLVVVDKPAGVQTLRRGEELHWDASRKALGPTLDELIPQALGKPSLKVHAVHRLDRDTSGLMLFALSDEAKIALIRMFKKHQVQRTYIAIVHGIIEQAQTIDTMLVRDRGDGIRGSGSGPDAKRAITHVKPIRQINRKYTFVECRLETGRTHQIRIHLSQISHMLCGEKVYLTPSANAPARPDNSGAPRQALHSAELKFTHPISRREMHFRSDLPKDLARWLQRL